MQEKDCLRLKMKAYLKMMTEEEHAAKAAKIAQRLFALEEWKHAKTIGVTISVFPEIPTRGIIEQAWIEGKSVSVPKCNPAAKTMQFKTITSFNELESVYHGLLEPIESTPEVSYIDLLIVPGLLFTKQGYRLGFGGGYYDRFLSSYQGDTVALAYESQIKDSLPIEEHDIPVGKLVTPTSVIAPL